METGSASGSWGTQANNNVFNMVDEAFGYVEVNAAGSGNITLSTNNGSADESRPTIIKLTGARTAVGNIIVPTIEKFWIVWNATTGGFDLTVKTTAGTGVAVGMDERTLLYADGTNVLDGINFISSLTLGAALPVASGGTAATTASGARTALSAAASGANSDITSLSALSTPLSIAQGGTAATTASAALTSLGALGLVGGTLTGDLTLPAFSDLASGATTDLGSIDSNFIRVTGSTGPITSFGTVAAGTWRVVRFASTPTLTYNASALILPGAASITAAANDGLFAISLGGGNWYIPFYQRAIGTFGQPGSVLQKVVTISTTIDSTTLTIPNDNTAPTSSEGKNYSPLNTTFTPKSATSQLHIRVLINLSPSDNARVFGSLFNGGANAIAANRLLNGGTVTDAIWPLPMEYLYSPGSVDPISFSVRYAGQTGGTVYVNRGADLVVLGGTIYSSIEITEIAT